MVGVQGGEEAGGAEAVQGRSSVFYNPPEGGSVTAAFLE